MLQQASETYISQTRASFHCQFKVKIPQDFGEDLLNESFAFLDTMDRRYNSHQPGSFIDRINKNAGHFVQTDEALVFMIDQIQRVGNATNGAFDITSMPLLKLYGWYAENVEFPSHNALSDALKYVGQNRIICNGIHIKTDPGQEIISGAFLKSFAIDRLLDFLSYRGVTDALVNAGGSTIRPMVSAKTDWSVNIPHPSDLTKKIAEIPLSNKAFSLSGRHGNLSHIVNAKTGKLSKNLQSGVLADDGFTADILSTALLASDAVDFEKHCENLKQHFAFEAYLIDEKGNLKTTGYEPFQSIRP